MQPPRFARALRDIHPRSAQVLVHRLVDGRSRDGCAALYAIPPAAWDVLFFRAARELASALEGSVEAPRTFADEQQQAAVLSAACDDASRVTAMPLLVTVATLKEQGAEVRQLLDQAEREAEASPGRARETWLRRIAIVAIVALTAYFWFRDKQNEPPIHKMSPYLTEPRR